MDGGRKGGTEADALRGCALGKRQVWRDRPLAVSRVRPREPAGVRRQAMGLQGANYREACLTLSNPMYPNFVDLPLTFFGSPQTGRGDVRGPSVLFWCAG